MTAQTISAKNGTEETAPSASVSYDFGDNLEEAVELFGGDVVFSRFKAAAIVDLQALIRRNLEADKEGKVKSEEDIQAAVNEWRPGVSSRKRRSQKEKAEEIFNKLSDEDRQALLESLLGGEAA